MARLHQLVPPVCCGAARRGRIRPREPGRGAKAESADDQRSAAGPHRHKDTAGCSLRRSSQAACPAQPSARRGTLVITTIARKPQPRRVDLCAFGVEADMSALTTVTGLRMSTGWPHRSACCAQPHANLPETSITPATAHPPSVFHRPWLSVWHVTQNPQVRSS